MRPFSLAALLVLAVASPALAQDGAAPVTSSRYLELRAKHATRLAREGPAPQEWTPSKPPAGVKEITYTSGKLELKGWFARPEGKTDPVPAVVFCHGGFSFDLEDWTGAAPFVEAGFALLCPTFRGENGNPGSFELMYGEVDDARAAVRWVAAQPGIDKDRIFTFGHSIGGGTSALLALFDEPKVLLTGSAAGLYVSEAFPGWWSDIAPFDVGDLKECRLRVLSANFDSLRHKHVGYVGKADAALGSCLPSVRKLAEKAKAPLEIEMVDGDHEQSLAPAVKKFIERAKAEAVKR